MSTTNHLARLPPELCNLILDYFSSKEVKTFRLVNRSCHDVCSHLLIKKAFFALRPKTLAVFKEIVEHPIFNRTVTEIVYDTRCVFLKFLIHRLDGRRCFVLARRARIDH